MCLIEWCICWWKESSCYQNARCNNKNYKPTSLRVDLETHSIISCYLFLLAFLAKYFIYVRSKYFSRCPAFINFSFAKFRTSSINLKMSVFVCLCLPVSLSAHLFFCSPPWYFSVATAHIFIIINISSSSSSSLS
jgi:hypothetical protein